MPEPNVETERLLEEVSHRQRNEIASWEAEAEELSVMVSKARRERDAALARLAEAEALLRAATFDVEDDLARIDAFLAAGDSDA